MDARRAVVVALAGGLVILVALAFAVTPLLVPGVAFAGIGIITPALVWIPARAVRIERRLTAREVVEDEGFRSTITVRAGRLGLPGGQLADPLGAELTAVRLWPAARRRTVDVEVLASFHRRGRKQLPPPLVQLSDPLGLATAVRRGTRSAEVLVLPRTSPVDWRARGGSGRRHAPERGTLAEALAASEIDGLRPYRPGTPASRIHWAALARGAGLLERRMRAEQDARPLVVLDARCDSDEIERLDAAVRAAASLVLELARAGACGLLTAETPRPLEVDHRLATWPAAHALLAVAALTARPPALAGRRQPSALFYVAASPLARPPRLLHETGGVLVLPADVPGPGRRPVVLEVSGCRGYALAPRATRAAAETMTVPR
jgi:uncharacterized protein (DUF58 family)